MIFWSVYFALWALRNHHKHVLPWKYFRNTGVWGIYRWSWLSCYLFLSDIFNYRLHGCFAGGDMLTPCQWKCPIPKRNKTWWRHQMETFSALLAICAGNSPVPGEFPAQRLWALIFSLICVWINDWVSNREAGDLRRYRAHYDVIVMTQESMNHVYIS